MSDIKGMQVVEVRGIRVLTTKQLAEAYGTQVTVLRENFRRNKRRYMEGKHYIVLEGQELNEIKRETQLVSVFKQVKKANLWTERGALLHAKSINTDQAWEVYDRLVDFYFRAKEVREEAKPAAVAPVQRKAHPMTIKVTDTPDNVKVQLLVKKLKKDIAGLDSVLDQFHRYISKEDYERLSRVADLMAMGLYKDTLGLADIQPNIVERIL